MNVERRARIGFSPSERISWPDQIERLRLARRAAGQQVDTALQQALELNAGNDSRILTRELAAAIQSFINMDKAYSDALNSGRNERI